MEAANISAGNSSDTEKGGFPFDLQVIVLAKGFPQSLNGEGIQNLGFILVSYCMFLCMSTTGYNMNLYR